MNTTLFRNFSETTPFTYSFIALCVLLITFAGCGVGGSDSSEGTLEVRLTDAPATYEAVYIDIQEVQINLGTETQENWETISTEPKRLDLLKLDNGADTLLATAQLETGTYNQLRFILGDNNEIIVDGESNSIIIPSSGTSGYQVNLNATITEDEPITKVIDFDVSRSIAVTGNGQYILNPVLKVYEPEETGQIKGQLVPQGIPALVSAQIGNETIATTYVEEDGTFQLSGLNANIYKVLVQPDSPQYADTTLFEKEVTVAQTTDVGIIQLPEN